MAAVPDLIKSPTSVIESGRLQNADVEPSAEDENWKGDLPFFFFFFFFSFFYFLLITKIMLKKKRAKLNGSNNWDLTEYCIDKNWNLENWNNKTES